MELPLALRRETRTNAGKPPVRYGYEHDIANGVSDSYVSPAHKAFIASLQSVSIPKDWKAAKLDPQWKERRNEGGAWCTSEEQDVGSSSTPSRKKSSWMQMGVHRKTDSRG